MKTTATLSHPPTGAVTSAPPHGSPDLRVVAGELVRDLIRRDPALWARVRADASLRRDFGFDDEPGPA